MNCGIYTITSPSGRQYIGSAIDFDRRWLAHRKQIRSGTHGNCNLLRAAKKYGLDRLVFRKIIICRPEDLLAYEQAAMDALKPQYNIAPIAGSSRGIKRSKEFKEKISKAQVGRVWSAETRAKIGAAHRGKRLTPEQIARWHANVPTPPPERAAFMHTPEAKAKQAKALIGHSVSAETKAKISAALKGRKHSPERIAAIMAGKGRIGCAAIVQQNGG